jgi:hypothetical protein
VRFPAWPAAAALAVLAAATAGAGTPAPAVQETAAQTSAAHTSAAHTSAAHTSAALPGRAGQDPCRWHAAAVRLAGSLAGRTDPRAQRLRTALERQGITADSPPPEGCGGTEQERPPAEDEPGDAAARPAGGVGRIAVGADGNQHDEDDWASSPMALAILAQRGLQANLVNYTYDNHIWDSDPTHRENMTESVLGAAERFGFDTSAFYDAADPDGLAAGVEDLTAEINASTPDDELTIVIAGPVETTWMALDAADPRARENVRCVSHGEGTFNQTHGETDHGGHSYDDVIDLGCRRVQIPDQNGNLGPTDMSDWDYLRESGDPALEWLHSRLELAEKGDVSDAGMVYFAITGEEEPTRSDLEALLTGPRADPPPRRVAAAPGGTAAPPPRAR